MYGRVYTVSNIHMGRDDNDKKDDKFQHYKHYVNLIYRESVEIYPS